MRMIWLSALLMLAAPAQAAGGEGEGAGERARAAVIANCRIPADRLAVERWTDPAMTVLVIKGAGPLSDEQIDCYASTLAGGDIGPVLEDAALSRRYEELAERDALVQARGFLQELGLLEGVPRQERNEPLDAYARRLEAYCGAPVGSVLRVEDGWISLAHTEDEPPSPSEDPQTWLCAFHAAVVAGYNPLHVRPVSVPSD
jgi:hypothetical protein